MRTPSFAALGSIMLGALELAAPLWCVGHMAPPPSPGPMGPRPSAIPTALLRSYGGLLALASGGPASASAVNEPRRPLCLTKPAIASEGQ